MSKKQLIARDSEYFKDNEEFIRLEFCKNDGAACKAQMQFMNAKLLLARKFIDKKEYPRALEEIKEAYDSIYDLKLEQCLKCGDLFREKIKNTLKDIIIDLKQMTSGFFGNKNYKPDLLLAENLLKDLSTR